MMTNGTKSITIILAAIALLAGPLSAKTGGQAERPDLVPAVKTPERRGVSAPLRELGAKTRGPARTEPGGPGSVLALPRLMPPLDLSRAGRDGIDPVVQKFFGAPSMPATAANFDGVGNVNGVIPPDANGDVGPNHYVQWVNLSLAVYDKSGTLLMGPIAGNQIWNGFGGACETNNDGDPIVVYDHLADRWLISQFAVPGGTQGYHECIAVSQTPDPTGAWHLYDYKISDTKMNDYPKFGVWPDGYYMTVNQFANGSTWAGAGVAVFERDVMISGGAARMIYWDLESVNPEYESLLPADLDGWVPSSNTPNPIVSVADNGLGWPADQLQIWECSPDWSNPSSSVLGASGNPNQNLDTAAFDSNLCLPANACIPQPAGPNLDAISERLMYRLQYRNFVTHESMVVNHTVDVDGTNHAGIRWYELRNGGSGWTIYQQGTYAPDGDNRWMGSVAMDGSGNMALGYSVSSSSTNPSVRYTGRLAGDPLGTLPQGESEIVAGGGSQTNSAARWGDYSSMSVDPVDQCTFWYTQEYYSATSSSNWKTRIASFKFPTCSPPAAGDLKGTVTDSASGLPVEGAIVKLGLVSTATQASGEYQVLNVPADTYDLTFSKYGYSDVTVPGVLIADGATTTVDAALTPIETAMAGGTVTDSAHGWPLYAKISISENTGFAVDVYTDPRDGSYSVELLKGATYTFEVSAFSAGYEEVEAAVAPATDPFTKSFTLSPDASLGDCPPGYGRSDTAVDAEDFESDNGGYTITDFGAQPTSWEWGTPTSGRDSAHSGTKAWATNLDGNYVVDEYGCIDSPNIDLSSYGGSSFKVSWWQYLDSEGGGRDTGEAYVSNDGGSNWTLIYQDSGAVNTDWTEYSVYLDSSYAVSDFKVIFCLYSDPTSIVYPGYYIDDVTVSATECAAQPGGLLVGNVRDMNTGGGVNGAEVGDGTRTAISRPTSGDTATGDGAYALFLPAGPTDITARGFGGYGTDTANVTITADAITSMDFDLPAGQASPAPAELNFTLSAASPTASAVLSINNAGTRDAVFELFEVNAPYVAPSVTGPFAPKTRHLGPKNLNFLNLRGVAYYLETPPGPPLAAGFVNSTFALGLDYGWGIGVVDSDFSSWVGNIEAAGGDDRNYEFNSAGGRTGRTIGVGGITEDWMADMAHDPYSNSLWQVNVGWNNCVHELSLDTLAQTGKTICPPFGKSQRGLAYNPLNDTFYSGSWSDGIVNHFTRDGTLLSATDVGIAISGLAFNPGTGHLFVLANDESPTNDIYVLDVNNSMAMVGAFDVGGLDDFDQAGLGIDCNGLLYAVNQTNQQVYKAVSDETGVCSWKDISWLSLSPGAVNAPVSGGGDLTVNVDGAGLAAGVYKAHIRVGGDTPYGTVVVPVTVAVEGDIPLPGSGGGKSGGGGGDSGCGCMAGPRASATETAAAGLLYALPLLATLLLRMRERKARKTRG